MLYDTYIRFAFIHTYSQSTDQVLDLTKPLGTKGTSLSKSLIRFPVLGADEQGDFGMEGLGIYILVLDVQLERR
jgi:hypothetical protein